MRPLRFLVTLLSFILAFALLLFTGGSLHDSDSAEYDTTDAADVSTSYFNWRTPSALFPPSAIISLTDDNSTFFLARPAAYGPFLPAKSLSGQLWIGSGFGDNHLGRAGYGAGAEGELGCSDVPGWADGSYRGGLWPAKRPYFDAKSDADPLALPDHHPSSFDEPSADSRNEWYPARGDGTDDHHLHPQSPSADRTRWKRDRPAKARNPAHADIQLLQESAEIAGKVVLLSRGGCGFLEKTKWVQRRGGVALIVGDDERGVPLVTMYARGDTSNITIPSLFTSHTTAHLLSSLVPGNTFQGDWDALTHRTAATRGKQPAVLDSKAQPQQMVPIKRKKSSSAAGDGNSNTKRSNRGDAIVDEKDIALDAPVRRRWFDVFYPVSSPPSAESETVTRLPTVGRFDWLFRKGLDDDSTARGKPSTQRSPAGSGSQKLKDGFRIGVHDWRDPDLLETVSSPATTPLEKSTDPIPPVRHTAGSITPGSGEYLRLPPLPASVSFRESLKALSFDQLRFERYSAWLRTLWSAQEEDDTFAELISTTGPLRPSSPLKSETINDYTLPFTQETALEHHEGLWVTLSPTSSSTSPFLDTLLVLVVSPLITLTVVYTLLLLRSRIRRRRWRAPKSVVERLPVRTYQTMPSPSTSSTSIVSALHHPTATTPLLPASPTRPVHARSRSRARTAPELAASAPSHGSTVLESSTVDLAEERRAAGLAEWRRRYGGKQRECVVCLDEYVDGVSRVMSLPCGHEFHAECITPWLTTRRRTCPICKGDVVRSLARDEAFAASSFPSSSSFSSSTAIATSAPTTHITRHSRTSSSTAAPSQSSSSSSPFPSNTMVQVRPTDIKPPSISTAPVVAQSADDVQDRLLVAVNDDPAAQRPVSREDEAREDLERGLVIRDGRRRERDR